MNHFSAYGFIFLLLFSLSACQTTGNTVAREEYVLLPQSNIRIPAEFQQMAAFDHFKVERYVSGSYTHDFASFDAGFINFEHYLRGGFPFLTPEQFKSRVDDSFKDISSFGPIVEGGNSHHKSIYTTIESKGFACLVIGINSGETIALKRGPGTESFSFSAFCQNEKTANFESKAIDLLFEARRFWF